MTVRPDPDHEPGSGPDLDLDSDDAPDRDPLDLLAEEFAHRCRRGEQPSIEEYVARHPDLAEPIRRLLPAVAFLERGKGAALLSGSGLGAETDGMGMIPPSRQLGENRVVRELGRGGMGIVYEAVQEPLGRRVAVKVLPRHALGDSASRRRFLREAQVVARLEHPNIVPIHAVGEQDGLPYYVMALVDGRGLDHLLADPSALPELGSAERTRLIARLGLQAAEALDYSHGQGILHRDIKPANLLLDASGTLWLADFGLAKLADDLSLTRTGELPGTLRYLAPECLHDEADARSDLYSLGLTLYELAVGCPAFAELNRARLLRQIESARVVAPRQLVPTLPRDLETIILKAMAYDRSARYATASALAEDLRRFLDDRPILARRATPAERLARAIRANPVVAALAGTSVVLALLAAFFMRFYLWPPPPPPPGSGIPWPPPRPEGFGPPDRPWGKRPPRHLPGPPGPMPGRMAPPPPTPPPPPPPPPT